ncbi:MAG: hypothetical protein ACREEN_01000 [Stellaceae bacterium]
MGPGHDRLRADDEEQPHRQPAAELAERHNAGMAITMTTISEQLNGIERLLGRIEERQKTEDEARRDLSKKVDGLRDNVGEALALGPVVHGLATKVETHGTAITKIEVWRQRRIGASGLLHGLGACLGAIVGALAERLAHWPR